MFRFLLVLLIVSCTQQKPSQHGYFSSQNIKNKDNLNLNFISYYQDYIYCRTNSEKSTKCFKKTTGNKDPQLYAKVKKEIEFNLKNIFLSYASPYEELLKEKISYCVTKESDQYHDCFKNKAFDHFQKVFSDFSQKNIKQLNGHELHFVKFNFEKHAIDLFEEKFLQYKNLEEVTLTEFLHPQVPHIINQLKNNPSIHKKLTNREQLMNECLQYMKYPQLKFITFNEFKLEIAQQQICNEVYNDPTLNSIVINNENKIFEKEYSKLLVQFEYEQRLGFYDCIKSKKHHPDACFEKVWDETSHVLEKKMLNQSNYRKIASEKPLVINRLHQQKSYFKKKIKDSY